MKAHRLVLLAAAGASVMALSGCTQSGNVAARIGDVTVPTSDVDFLTRMQCETLDRAAKDPSQAAQGGVRTVPLAQVRAAMLNTLVDAELNRQLAEEKDLTYDKATLNRVMEQFEQVIAQAPADDRDRFRDMVEDVYRGQLEVYTLAQADLANEGVDNPTQDQVDQAVAKIQSDYRKTVDIDVNPQYGADADGVAGKADPSLSLAVSSDAKQSRSNQPKSTWVAKLPADQRCG